jgi:SagB-type dehydrogenase family enzyme
VTASTSSPGTINVASVLYDDGVAPDDPAEVFHEASKLYPSLARRQTPGLAFLERSEQLRATAARAVRRNPELPFLELPKPRLPPTTLDEALRSRRSVREFADEPLELAQLSALLFAAYGVTDFITGETIREPQPLRTAASAGALYPLELHVHASRVQNVPPGLYHYDALEHGLRRQSPEFDLVRLTPTGDILPAAAAVVFISAVFWRSRFKYGLRGYRFALFEAGHVAQNLLLAGTACGLATVVVGGFFDSLLDASLGLDAVNESSLLAVAIGVPAEG